MTNNFDAQQSHPSYYPAYPSYQSKPILSTLRTSSHLTVSQPSHGLPTPISPDPFHFDTPSPLPCPTPKATASIPLSKQHYASPISSRGSPEKNFAAFEQYRATAQKAVRPVHIRRGSSLSRLDLDAAKERDRFGLAGLTVSTGSDDDDRDDNGSGELDDDDGVSLGSYDDRVVKDDSCATDGHGKDESTTIHLASGLHTHLDLLHHHDNRQQRPITDQLPTDRAMAADMSKSDTIRASPNQSSPSNTSSKTPTPSIPVPSNRQRQPVPPSPLSRIQSEPGKSTSHRTPPHGHHPTNHGYTNIPENSPCFIHSHLDRTGSMQDWLKQKNATGDHVGGSGGSGRSAQQQGRQAHLHNGPTPVRSPVRSGSGSGQGRQSAPQQYYAPHARHHDSTRSPTMSPGGSKLTSPILDGKGPTKGLGRDGSGSGYESDRSSQIGGSAILDGDLMDDEEEGGSLTRQLAETAQGVREMSKELGRTRVRSRIQHVLIVTKARDNRLIKLTRELALYLMQKKPASTSSETPTRPGTGNERGMVVYVDAQLRTSKRFDAAGLQRDHPQLFEPVGRRRSSSTTSVNTLNSAYPSSSSLNGDGLGMNGKRRDEGQLRYWTGEMCSNSPHLFDFVVTLGGDGTVLFTSWLFQRIVPPVLPFALGSLGFLTNFDFAKYKPTMDKVIDDGIRVNLRMRFTCTVYRAIAPEEAARANAKGKTRKAIKKPGGEILMSQVDKGGWEALEGPSRSDGEGGDVVVEGRDKEIMCFSTRPVEQFEVLNDLVVDRGPSPFVSLLELFGDEHHLTTVQADGLTVSTPTGSTAYSLSAGGSLVHPQIPAILITPICPHTLSFRPMLLPDSMELRICVPYNSRSTAWASFDGRGRVELKQGDHIKVTASKYPFPTVCADKASTDWFGSISRTLRWNEREKQKSFVVVEEDNEPSGPGSGGRPKKGMTQAEARKQAEHVHQELKEEDEDEGGDVARVPAEDGAGEVDEDDGEEDDEEEDEFDIDDKSGGETTNPSSPQNNPTDPSSTLSNHNIPARRLDTTYHKPGVDTPDRFATPYAAPPPLSQRHLVEALAAAELDSKEGEVGQRDEIRSGPEGMRVEGGRGGHLIPPGRGVLTPVDGDGGAGGSGGGAAQEGGGKGKEPVRGLGAGESGEDGSGYLPEKTPKPSHGRGHGHGHGHGQGHTRPPYMSRSVSDLSVEVKRQTKKREEVCKAKAFAFFGQDDSASDMSDETSEC